MKRHIFSYIVLTFLFAVGVCCLIQDEALAIGENNKGLQLLSTKYPPHEYEIEIVERKEEATNENMIQSTFKGPGGANINFTGSFVGTVRITGGITFGGILGPGMLNSTVGKDNTKTISLSQNYAVKMLKPEVYIVTARPIYEYCKFNVRNKRTREIVDHGNSERPIGLQCTHHTEEERDAKDREMLKNKHDEEKPVSLTDRAGTEAECLGQEIPLFTSKYRGHRETQHFSIWEFLCTLGE